MISTRMFSELLEILHRAVLEPDNWKLFLEKTCVATHSRHGFFVCSSSNLGLRVLSHGGGEDMMAAQKAYNESAGAIDPFRMPVLLHPRTGILDGDDLIPPREFMATPLYRRLLQPVGLRYLTIMAVSVLPRRMEALSFWRGLDQGPMGADEREVLSLLLPHVRIALEVRNALLAAERHCADLQALLDQADSAAFLLCPRGKVLEHNAEAKALLGTGKAFELRKGRLCPVRRAHDRDWERLFAFDEMTPGRAFRGGAMLLHHEKTQRRPLHVVAAPWTAPPANAAMLVLVTDPDRERCFPDSVLKGLYGLTPAETEVANAYLTGYSTDEIALLRRVSVSTVRSQLKVLLQKTNTSRQSDLLRVLMSIPRPATGNQHANGAEGRGQLLAR